MDMPNIVENDLPEGWRYVRLDDIADLNMGQSPPGTTYNDEGIGLPFFQGKADFGGLYPVTRVWCTSPKKVADEGDILISVRAPVGPTNMAAERCCIGRGLAGITPRLGIPSEFLLYYFRCIEDELALSGTGSTFTAIKKSDLVNLGVPLPPLTEQKRIVAKVEDLLARVNAARERIEKVPATMKRFRQAVLATACSGRLSEDWREDEFELSEHDGAGSLPAYFQGFEIPSNWNWVNLGGLARNVQYGVSVKGSKDKNYGVPILRMGNIQDGRVTIEDIQYVPKAKSGFNGFVLSKGDILFNRTNSPELVGKAAVFKESIEAVFASYIIRIILDPNNALSDYVCWWVNSLWGRRWAEAVKTDGVSQSNINATKLKTLLIPLPPIEEQKEIVRRVEGLFALADKVEERVARARAAADRLEQAVLAKAFRGELVPTEAELARREGRDYEPAEALLKRVKGEREAKEKTPTERRAGRGRKLRGS